MSGHLVQPARLQERVGDGAQCLTCERRCVILEGERGWCRTRQTIDGTVHTLIYGIVTSLSYNPIEKKPLYHFYPGSVALTAGSLSCNFDCPWCQNWRISKAVPPKAASEPRHAPRDEEPTMSLQRQKRWLSADAPAGSRFVAVEDFVAQARERGCQGTSISFNEPTLSLEWSLDVFPIAQEAGLYNTFVTNGYMTEEALTLLVEAGLDGMNVDVKGDNEAVREYCRADVDVVWRNCRQAREAGVWIEITTLVIPRVNDSAATLRSIARRIADELGPDTPWHVSRYFPAYEFDAAPTPVATLRRAQAIGREAGLRYVYPGNVGRRGHQDTICPECGTILVRRDGLRRSVSHLTAEGRCSHCGEAIPGVGWDWAVGG